MAPSKPKLVTPTAADVAALIAGARLPERTVDICLRGDLLADLDEARTRLMVAAAGAPSLGDGPAQVREEIAGIEAQMRAASVTFRLRALSRAAFNQIIVDRPPRAGVKRDQDAGYDVHAVESAMIRACTVDPDLSAEQWDGLEAALTPFQFGALVASCDSLNLDPLLVPRSPAG